MTFRCAAGHISRHGEKQMKVVMQTRRRIYENGGVGFEIVREERLCREHGTYLESMMTAEARKLGLMRQIEAEHGSGTADAVSADLELFEYKTAGEEELQ